MVLLNRVKVVFVRFGTRLFVWKYFMKLSRSACASFCRSCDPQRQHEHITEETLQKYINKINPNKANDIYKIKPAIIRDLADFLPPILAPLFNAPIDENEYPDSLKYTKLIELYKTGDTTLPSNYRPISLLSIIAKLLDAIINDQLMNYLVVSLSLCVRAYGRIVRLRL